MALKTFNPITPGQRQLVLVDRTGLHKGGPLKILTEGAGYEIPDPLRFRAPAR